jgi:type I restriction enzyme M protein
MRDKRHLDIFWLKDEALEERANLPSREVIVADIASDLDATRSSGLLPIAKDEK